MPFVDELLRSEAGLSCVETRLSWIFLSEARAWKIKKPVTGESACLDTPEARREACALEIARGALHAPGIYLGLVPVTREAGGGLRLGGEGEPVDWSIEMRRLPEADRADHRLQAGRLHDDHVRRIAEHVVAFHVAAPADSEVARFASPEAIAARIGWAFGRGDRLAPADAASPGVLEVEAWQHGFIDENADLFRQRVLNGWVRDGHGDLCLENLFVDDAGHVAAVDGAKRNLEFRQADVAADVATLSLDLALHGRADLAERFIAAYAHAANDFDLYAVVDFYESCRANLEGKTADRLRRDPNVALALRERAEQNAMRYTRAAIAFARRPFLPPMVVALSGLVATGKSSVARAIAHQIAAPIVSADATRDFMIFVGGVIAREALHELEWERAFHPGFRDEVYDEVFRRAAVVLASGRPIVIDGCFGTRALRERAAALARKFGTPFFFVECTAAESIVRERLRQRAETTGQAVETWQNISEDFAALWEPATDMPEAEHIVLDTGLPLDVNVRALEDLLPVWPDELQ